LAGDLPGWTIVAVDPVAQMTVVDGRAEDGPADG